VQVIVGEEIAQHWIVMHAAVGELNSTASCGRQKDKNGIAVWAIVGGEQ
jgi:hypothetical protein